MFKKNRFKAPEISRLTGIKKTTVYNYLRIFKAQGEEMVLAKQRKKASKKASKKIEKKKSNKMKTNKKNKRIFHFTNKKV